MDQNELYEIEMSRKSNKCYLFIKTFKFLLPFSLLSFLVSYAAGFSFFFTYHFQIVFALFAHGLERKYMFLIFNGILAFLVRTLNFNSSSLPALDFDDYESIKQDNADMDSESIRQDFALAKQEEEEVCASPQESAIAEEDKVKVQEKGNQEADVSFTSKINGGKQPGGLIIDNEDQDMFEVEEDLEEEEEDMEEGGAGLLGASAAGAQEEIGVNVDTEELNKKFEEFIRKMKEELRIQAEQPQLIAV